MTMIERVARAMCVEMGIPPDDWHEDNGERVYAWMLEADTARAAIEAMRIPDAHMLNEGYGNSPSCVSPNDCAEIYSNMIDAALAGEKP